MSGRKTAALQILVSLLFAAVMVGCAWVTKGSEHSLTLTMLLLAVWWVPFTALAGLDRCTGCCGMAWVRRLLRRS